MARFTCDELLLKFPNFLLNVANIELLIKRLIFLDCSVHLSPEVVFFTLFVAGLVQAKEEVEGVVLATLLTAQALLFIFISSSWAV